MKQKITSLLLAALLGLTGAKADVSFAGKGTSADPYQISSVAQLQELSALSNSGEWSTYQKSYYKLTADLDMSEVENFTPICHVIDTKKGFSGSFDGDGHVIRNLKITVAADNTGHVGLIGSLQSNGSDSHIIKNVILDGVTITNNYTGTEAFSIGALQGRDGSCTIENCAVLNFTISKINEKAANHATAAFGYRSSTADSKLVRCYTDYTGTFSGKGSKAPAPEANYSYAGTASQLTSGELCYMINGSSSEDPVWFQTIGTDAHPVLNKTHATVYIKTTLQCDGVTPAEGAEISYSNDPNATVIEPHGTFTGGFCDKCGNMLANGDGFYEIENADQLLWFGNYVNKGETESNAVLKANIDMAGKGWTAMNEFAGTFDGGNFTVSNLGTSFCYSTEGDAVIRNLTLSASSAIGSTKAEAGCGVFVCQNNKLAKAGSLLIENCVNNVALNNTSGKNWTGAFIGGAANGSADVTTTIRNCVNNAAITATNEAVSGFIGNARKGKIVIENCTNNGAITAPKSVAGFIGQAQTPASVTITGCKNTGVLTAQTNTDSRVGGIIGTSYNISESLIISGCANEASVTGENDLAGGIVALIGKLTGDVTIENCYNTGAVSSKTNTAGILTIEADYPNELNIVNVWNSGSVEGNAFASAEATCTNCYDVNSEGDGVTKISAAQLASGEVAYKLNGDQTAIVWFETIGTDAAPSFSGETVYKTSDAGWGTFFDTEKAYAFTGVKAYTGKIDGSVLKLTEVSQANAGTPVILEGTYYNKVAKATPAEMPENDLKGTATDLAADGSQYVLAKKDDVVGFYQATEGTIAAGKAYLTGIAAGVKAVTFGTIDGIVSPLGETEEGAAIYDLSGRRVEKATKGLYIINGKKILF